MREPATEPMWIMGPSGPAGMPEPTASTQLKNLAASTERVNVLGMITPLRNPAVSLTQAMAGVGRVGDMVAGSGQAREGRRERGEKGERGSGGIRPVPLRRCGQLPG